MRAQDTHLGLADGTDGPLAARLDGRHVDEAARVEAPALRAQHYAVLLLPDALARIAAAAAAAASSTTGPGTAGRGTDAPALGGMAGWLGGRWLAGPGIVVGRRLAALAVQVPALRIPDAARAVVGRVIRSREYFRCREANPRLRNFDGGEEFELDGGVS